jgi:hypothetical protein
MLPLHLPQLHIEVGNMRGRKRGLPELHEQVNDHTHGTAGTPVPQVLFVKWAGAIMSLCFPVCTNKLSRGVSAGKTGKVPACELNAYAISHECRKRSLAEPAFSDGRN